MERQWRRVGRRFWRRLTGVLVPRIYAQAAGWAADHPALTVVAALVDLSLAGPTRAWLGYRDAFLAFAAVKYPRVSRDSLAAWITQNRSQIIPGI